MGLLSMELLLVRLIALDALDWGCIELDSLGDLATTRWSSAYVKLPRGYQELRGVVPYVICLNPKSTQNDSLLGLFVEALGFGQQLQIFVGSACIMTGMQL